MIIVIKKLLLFVENLKILSVLFIFYICNLTAIIIQ